tara:strand:- start:28141 stop:28296 length:156 start_codon:yes stop_codon:yes gene_type:complete
MSTNASIVGGRNRAVSEVEDKVCLVPEQEKIIGISSPNNNEVLFIIFFTIY